jgi:uncharacterized RDD family membrane protein YckC
MDREQHELGVYYHRSDYCGLGRRFLVDVVDVVSALLAWYVFVFLLLLLPKFQLGIDTLFATLLIIWFAYFVILKWSPLGTLGYRVGGVKIVTVRGTRPSFFAYCERFFFSILGPFNFLLDLLWLWTDPFGQTLRDKLTHAYVVRARAEPLGSGRVVYSSYHIMGWNLLFAEVRQEKRHEAR